MGCTSTKPSANKSGSNESATPTLLNCASVKAGSSDVLQYRMIQFALKPGSFRKVLEVVKSQDTKKALTGASGLLDVRVFIPAGDELIIQSSFSSESEMQSSESKVDEAFKALSELCVDAPARFAAKGGIVEFAGPLLWSLSGGVAVEHRVIRGSIKTDSVNDISETLNSPKIQKDLAAIVGLLNIEVVLQSERSLFMHSFHVSEEAAQASQTIVQDVFDSLREFLEDSSDGVQEAEVIAESVGSQIWTFTPSVQVSTDLDEQPPAPESENIQKQPTDIMQLTVAQEASLEPNVAKAPQSWLFGACCASPQVS